MATRGTVEIPVSFKTASDNLKQVMQSIQSIMTKVDPSSTIYKNMSKTYEKLAEQADKFSSKVASGYTDAVGLRSMNKDLEGISSKMVSIERYVGDLNLKDRIGLDSTIIHQYESLKKELADSVTALEKVKKESIASTFGPAMINQIKKANSKIELSDSTLGTYDKLKRQLDSVNNALDNAKRKTREYNEEVKQAELAYRMLGGDATDITRTNAYKTRYSAALSAAANDNSSNLFYANELQGIVSGDSIEQIRAQLSQAWDKLFDSNNALISPDKAKQILSLIGLDEDSITIAIENITENSPKIKQTIDELPSRLIRGMRSNAKTGINAASLAVASTVKSNLINENSEAKKVLEKARVTRDNSNETVAKYQQEATDLNTILTNMESAITNLRARIDAAAGVVDSHKKALSDYEKSSGSAGIDGINGAADFRSAAKSATGEDTDRALGSIENQKDIDSVTNSISNAAKTWMGFGQVARIVRQGLRSAINDIKALDKAMTNISVVTNFTNKELWGSIDSYMATAQQYGVTTQGVYEVSQLYYQQGLKTAEVNELTTETLKMARIAGMGYSEAADGMTVAIRAFKMEMSDAATVTDVYSKVASITASDSQELITAMSKVASGAANVGSSFENTTSMLAVMIEATREGASNLGSALKSVIARYGEMKTGNTVDENGEAIDYNKVDTALKSIGISIKDAQGQFRDFDDVIFELADAWDTLDSTTQRYISTVFAGNRQQSRFIALVSNGERLREVTNAAANSADAGLVQYAKTLDSLESKANQIKTSFQQFYMTIANGSTISAVLGFINSFVKGLNQINTITSIGNMMTIVKGLKVVLNLVVSRFVTSFNTIRNNWHKTLLDMSTDISNEGDKAAKTWREKFNIQKGQLSSGTGIAKALNGKLGNILSIGAMGLTTAGTTLAQTNATGGAVLSGFGNIISGAVTGSALGPWGMLAGAIAGLGTGVIGLIEAAQNEAEQQAQLAREKLEELNVKRAEAVTEANELNQSITALEELEQHKYDSTERYDEWINANQELANKYPELIDYIDQEGNMIVDLNKASDVLKATFEKTTVATTKWAQQNLNTKKDEARAASQKKQLWYANTQFNQVFAGHKFDTTDQFADFINILYPYTNANAAANSYNINSLQKYDIETQIKVFSELLTKVQEGNFSNQQAMIDVLNGENGIIPILTSMVETSSAIDEAYKTNFATLIRADIVDTKGILNANSKEFNILDKAGNNLIDILGSYYSQAFEESGKNVQQFVERFLPSQTNISTEDELWAAIADLPLFGDSGLLNNLTTLTTDELTEFTDILNNLNSYTLNEFDILISRLIGDDETDQLYEAILAAYKAEDDLFDFEKAVESRIENDAYLFELLDAGSLEQSLSDKSLKSILAVGDKLWNQQSAGVIGYGQEILNDILELYSMINDESIISDSNIKSQLTNILDSADLLSIDGLVKAEEEMLELVGKENEAGFKLIFGIIKNFISVNLPTIFDEQVDTIQNNLNNYNNDLKNATKGMNYKEATALASKLGKSIADFDVINGKYYYKNIQDIQDYYDKENNKLLSIINGRIEQVKTTLIEPINLELLDNIEDDTTRQLAKTYLDEYKQAEANGYKDGFNAYLLEKISLYEQTEEQIDSLMMQVLEDTISAQNELNSQLINEAMSKANAGKKFNSSARSWSDLQALVNEVGVVFSESYWNTLQQFYGNDGNLKIDTAAQARKAAVAIGVAIGKTGEELARFETDFINAWEQDNLKALTNMGSAFNKDSYSKTEIENLWNEYGLKLGYETVDAFRTALFSGQGIDGYTLKTDEFKQQYINFIAETQGLSAEAAAAYYEKVLGIQIALKPQNLINNTTSKYESLIKKISDSDEIVDITDIEDLLKTIWGEDQYASHFNQKDIEEAIAGGSTALVTYIDNQVTEALKANNVTDAQITALTTKAKNDLAKSLVSSTVGSLQKITSSQQSGFDASGILELTTVLGESYEDLFITAEDGKIILKDFDNTFSKYQAKLLEYFNGITDDTELAATLVNQALAQYKAESSWNEFKKSYNKLTANQNLIGSITIDNIKAFLDSQNITADTEAGWQQLINQEAELMGVTLDELGNGTITSWDKYISYAKGIGKTAGNQAVEQYLEYLTNATTTINQLITQTSFSPEDLKALYSIYTQNGGTMEYDAWLSEHIDELLQDGTVTLKVTVASAINAELTAYQQALIQKSKNDTVISSLSGVAEESIAAIRRSVDNTVLYVWNQYSGKYVIDKNSITALLNDDSTPLDVVNAISEYVAGLVKALSVGSYLNTSEIQNAAQALFALGATDEQIKTSLHDGIITLEELAEILPEHGNSLAESLEYYGLALNDFFDSAIDLPAQILTTLGIQLSEVTPDLRDSIKSAEKTAASDFMSLMAGTGTAQQAQRFKADYTESVEGIKIAHEGLWEALNNLRETDYLTYNQVRYEIAKDATVINENYTEIDYVTKDIQALEAKIQAHSEKITDEEREQLSILKGISAQLSLQANTDAFDWLNRDQLGNMQNFTTFANDAREALVALGKGEVDPKQFVNILEYINEFGNVSANLEEAYDLYWKAITSGKDIQVSDYLSMSGEEISESLKDALNVQAKAQVEYLDGQINFLEGLKALQDFEYDPEKGDFSQQLVDHLKDSNINLDSLAKTNILYNGQEYALNKEGLDALTEAWKNDHEGDISGLVNLLSGQALLSALSSNEFSSERETTIELKDNEMTVNGKSIIELPAIETTVSNIDQNIAAIAGYIGSNVDIHGRPVVSGDKMRTAGWTEFNGDYATEYTHTYSAGQMAGADFNNNSNVIFSVTPILPNGEVLSPQQLNSYIEEILSKGLNSNNYKELDTKGLITQFFDYDSMGVGTLDEAYAKANEAAQARHEQEALLYDTFKTNTQTVNTALENQLIPATEDFASTINSAATAADDVASALRDKAQEIRDVQFSGTVGTNNSSLIGTAVAKGTLMGELGPEAWVSGGKYHVAGQNGPEVVNLPEDAIVFNHIQTADLLKRGHTSTRGHAVTNQYIAAGMAAGTLSKNGGFAHAGIDATIDELKRLKQLWEGLLNQSAKSLVSGASGGGGGGGDNTIKAHIEDLEEWYNLLRRISQLEQKINNLQAERANINDGHSYLISLREETNLLEEQLITQKQLYQYQVKQLKAQEENINNNKIWSKFLHVDKTGLLQYIYGNEANGGKGALSVLQQLNNMSGADQLKYVKGLGYSYTDTEGQALDGEDLVAQFYEELQAQIDQYDELYDTVLETESTISDLNKAVNDIEEEIRDNQEQLEQTIYDLIVNNQQQQIDQLKDQTDAIKDGNDKYINGLSDALQRERDMYDQSQSTADREQLQRQLALLRRAGGSTSEIASLEEQLDSKLKDEYFQHQEDAINAIQEANDKQVEQLEHQTRILEEQLQYQKDNGVIWLKVYEALAGSDSEILAFMEGKAGAVDFFQQSNLQQEDMLVEWAKMVGIYNEEQKYQYNKSLANSEFNTKAWQAEGYDINGLKNFFSSLDANKQKELATHYTDNYAEAIAKGMTADEASRNASSEFLRHLSDEQRAAKAKGGVLGNGGNTGATTGGAGAGNGSGGIPKYSSVSCVISGEAIGPSSVAPDKTYTIAAKGGYVLEGITSISPANGGRIIGKTQFQATGYQRSITITVRTRKMTEWELSVARGQQASRDNITTIPQAATGTYTGNQEGLIYVHKKERILSEEQTDAFEKLVDGLTSNNSLINQVKSAGTRISSIMSGLGQNIGQQNNNVNIDPNAIVLNVQSINDKYDIHDIVSDVMDEVTKLVSKASSRGVSRR